MAKKSKKEIKEEHDKLVRIRQNKARILQGILEDPHYIWNEDKLTEGEMKRYRL